MKRLALVAVSLAFVGCGSPKSDVPSRVKSFTENVKPIFDAHEGIDFVKVKVLDGFNETNSTQLPHDGHLIVIIRVGASKAGNMKFEYEPRFFYSYSNGKWKYKYMNPGHSRLVEDDDSITGDNMNRATNSIQDRYSKFITENEKQIAGAFLK